MGLSCNLYFGRNLGITSPRIMRSRSKECAFLEESGTRFFLQVKVPFDVFQHKITGKKGPVNVIKETKSFGEIWNNVDLNLLVSRRSRRGFHLELQVCIVPGKELRLSALLVVPRLFVVPLYEAPNLQFELQDNESTTI